MPVGETAEMAPESEFFFACLKKDKRQKKLEPPQHQDRQPSPGDKMTPRSKLDDPRYLGSGKRIEVHLYSNDDAR